MYQRKVGGILSDRKDKGPLVRGGEKTSHQCTGAEGSKICNSSLYSEQETFEQHPHSNGQHGGSFLSSKNGGTNNQDLVGLNLFQ